MGHIFITVLNLLFLQVEHSSTQQNWPERMSSVTSLTIL